MRIKKEETVGLVIDIQDRLVAAMSEKEVLVKNSKILVEGLQALGVPTAFTQQYTKGLGDTVAELKDVVEGFSFIEKTDFSCCQVEEYAAWLKEQGKKNVVLCGIESHVCVLQTAIDLKEAGYNPIVVMDCVSSRTEANKALAAERFRYEGIMMTSYESILFELTGSAKAEGFKTISKLVK
ncbi:hydrolase [Puteibacter caeruleilacunae]|nr:hydrolase [Puteibacter caeruleilacunae]